MNEAAFIEQLFNNFGGQNEDSFSFLTSNMLLVGAKIYSEDPTAFNLFENQNYILMLRSYLTGPFDVDKPHLKDIGLSSLFFLFKQKKHCLVRHLIERPDNHDILNAFLRVAKTTNQDNRQSFLVAMRELLKIQSASPVVEEAEAAEELTERESDIIRMIFSNMTTPEKFPQEFGQIGDSISFLVQMADTPFEEEELLCLRLIKQLVKHKWGCKAWFLNQKAIKYTLDRAKDKQSAVPQATESHTIKKIAEKKFSLVDQIVKESGFINDSAVIDSVLAAQLLNYHGNGVYGSSA